MINAIVVLFALNAVASTASCVLCGCCWYFFSSFRTIYEINNLFYIIKVRRHLTSETHQSTHHCAREYLRFYFVIHIRISLAITISHLIEFTCLLEVIYMKIGRNSHDSIHIFSRSSSSMNELQTKPLQLYSSSVSLCDFRHSLK